MSITGYKGYLYITMSQQHAYFGPTLGFNFTVPIILHAYYFQICIMTITQKQAEILYYVSKKNWTNCPIFLIYLIVISDLDKRDGLDK